MVTVGFDSVGVVPNTNAPVPVSPVTAAAKLADDGVPKNVATPVPRLVIPVPPRLAGSVPVVPPSIGRPVALVKVADDGVPSAGVTSVGLVDSTTLPDPVDVVTPVPPLATGSVPVTPVLSGSPVQLVKVPEEGVPSTGVVRVGLANVGEMK